MFYLLIWFTVFAWCLC